MDAFWLIYERYNRDVYRFALFLTGDPTRADDLVSDTFVRAWTARERIQQETVKGYLLTIARNLHRDQLRATRRFVELEETIEDEAPGVDLMGVFNPGVLLGACFLTGAVVTFVSSFYVKPESRWRALVGLDDETLKSLGGRRR